MGAWNGTEKSLSKSLTDLEKRNILRRIIFDQKKTVVYHLTDVKNWKID
jgi:DNA-binding HxlR family transcriptional regulator